jgi:hypothetical protein
MEERKTTESHTEQSTHFCSPQENKSALKYFNYLSSQFNEKRFQLEASVSRMFKMKQNCDIFRWFFFCK